MYVNRLTFGIDLVTNTTPTDSAGHEQNWGGGISVIHLHFVDRITFTPLNAPTQWLELQQLLGQPLKLKIQGSEK